MPAGSPSLMPSSRHPPAAHLIQLAVWPALEPDALARFLTMVVQYPPHPHHLWGDARRVGVVQFGVVGVQSNITEAFGISLRVERNHVLRRGSVHRGMHGQQGEAWW